MDIQIIGHIHTDLPDKFGVPRQSGLVNELKGYIEFEPKYGQKEAFNGLEDYEYIWILFIFHKAIKENNTFSATVKPPKLGGNIRKGVFSTRSPFRPNNIGLSCVKLDEIIYSEKGTILKVSGPDLIDNTPIIDIKPYLPYTDSHAGAKAGFADTVQDYKLNVIVDEKIIELIPITKRQALIDLLKEDPRPGYQKEPGREYGMYFDNYNIRFIIETADKYNNLIITSITER